VEQLVDYSVESVSVMTGVDILMV